MVCWFVRWWFGLLQLCRFWVLRAFWEKCSNLNAIIHSKVIKKTMNNHWKFIPNWSKILPKSTKNGTRIDENTLLGGFRRQIAPTLAPGRSIWDGSVTFGSLFGRKWCSKGQFFSPAGIQNLSKIARLGLDRCRVPRKMISRRGFGKNVKI